MTSKEFWGYVETQRLELVEQHRERERRFREFGDPAAWQGQPEHGHSIYIVSKPRKGPGAVVEAGMRLAAQRIVEVSHDVATAAQIEKHLAEREEQRLQIAANEEKMNKGPRAVFVKSAEAPIRKGAA
jgi:hypothetical protein